MHFGLIPFVNDINAYLEMDAAILDALKRFGLIA